MAAKTVAPALMSRQAQSRKWKYKSVAASATPTSFVREMSDRQRRQRAERSDEQTERTGRDAGRLRVNNPRSLPEEMRRKISPITYVSADAPPFLLIHGTADRTVGVYHSDDFVKVLRDAGAKDITYKRYDGAGHNAFFANIEETRSAREAFFERTLKKES